jgi:large subunit ribosomal protein L18
MAKAKKKIYGTAERPRLAVFRSLKHIYVQFIDDAQGKTLAAATSLKIKKTGKAAGKAAVAEEVGKLAAEAARAKGISQVIFDRRKFRFHGRIKALAKGAREGGLLF